MISEHICSLRVEPLVLPWGNTWSSFLTLGPDQQRGHHLERQGKALTRPPDSTAFLSGNQDSFGREPHCLVGQAPGASTAGPGHQLLSRVSLGKRNCGFQVPFATPAGSLSEFSSCSWHSHCLVRVLPVKTPSQPQLKDSCRGPDSSGPAPEATSTFMCPRSCGGE